MLHELTKFWFLLVKDGGYLGVAALMAMESTIFPVPSEIVIPPAAFWAAQGKMSFAGVIAAGTIGSYVGSALSYWVAQWVGIPFVKRFGTYFLLSPAKLAFAEKWVKQYSVFGILMARLLPVVRHLISIPAGILRMGFFQFSLATVLGSFLWCTVLAYFGREVIGGRPDLLDSPEALVSALKEKLHVIVFCVLALGVAYLFVQNLKRKLMRKKNYG